ncbi:TAXI family TRAP transporter solute-binding subunit [Thiothrix nivea]|uniref:Uncharacterized protein n=1 Tax=Thiothrix nivea (strain ATCC 35100 / DSM 5205 / JP2) TaxID=870187 RepID=A0A656HJE5_THINJ|nr:TAXI family TRAP transporter solute-binding subunit [Thiothrix nivea]EIJ36567.1 hypothetical protein Thini_4074 [Thiothrix nivea DSM 5205]
MEMLERVLIKFLESVKEYSFPVLMAVIFLLIIIIVGNNKSNLLITLVGIAFLASGLFAPMISEKIDNIGRFFAIFVGCVLIGIALFGSRIPSQPPNTPSQPPNTPSQPPNTPSQPPNTPSQPPNTPSQPPNTPSQPPNTPSQPPNTPSQPPNTPSQPPNTPSQPPNTPSQPFSGQSIPSLAECVDIINRGMNEPSKPFGPLEHDNCSDRSPSSVFSGWEDNIGLAAAYQGTTYYDIGCDIKKIMRPYGINIIVQETEGSEDNIRKVRSPDKAYSFGLIQGDFIQWARVNPEFKNIVDKIKPLASLYDQEIHLFAKKSINNIDELKDKRISYGKMKFGGHYSAVNILNNITGIVKNYPNNNLISENETPAEGICKVLLDEVDAMFYTGGAPVLSFKKLEDLFGKYPSLKDKAHLVSLTPNDVSNSPEYSPAKISKSQYSWLDKEQISTLSTKAILFTYDFRSEGDQYHKYRCDQLNDITNGIQNWLNNNNYLGEGFHSKWSEVKDGGLWKKPCR